MGTISIFGSRNFTRCSDRRGSSLKKSPKGIMGILYVFLALSIRAYSICYHGNICKTLKEYLTEINVMFLSF